MVNLESCMFEAKSTNHFLNSSKKAHFDVDNDKDWKKKTDHSVIALDVFDLNVDYSN